VKNGKIKLMSGHSKWATIHRQKEAADQKRGQAFTKLANAITIAVRESGGVTDPESNFKLRLAADKAKALNMPKENIQRAIDRAVGKGGGAAIEEVAYEGYGPGGVGIIVEAATDNRQRTVQEIKNIFDRSGGSIASPGSVAFNFQKTGLIVLETDNKEELMLKAIDFGAEDVSEVDEKTLEVYVGLDRLEEVKNRFSQEGMVVKSAEITQKPLNLITISDQKVARQVLGLVEKLEALDDVQQVHANFDIPEEFLNA
jgi:YebC/PmpR family DNA-binding regulatory protein